MKTSDFPEWNTDFTGWVICTVEVSPGVYRLRRVEKSILKIPGPPGADGADGAPGPPGADGIIGADGNTVLYGAAAPTTEGVDGNFYIRTTTNFIYGPKAGGVWPAGTSLIGPAGANGANGANGTDFVASYNTLPYAASVDLDLTSADTYVQISLTGNLALTTSNRAAARNKVVFLVCDGSNRTLSFPVGWIFVNASGKPTTINANKTGVLSIVCRDANDSGVLACYTEQP